MLLFASCWHASAVLTSGTIVGCPTIRPVARLVMSLLVLWSGLGMGCEPSPKVTSSSRRSFTATAHAQTAGQGSHRHALQVAYGERTAWMEDRARLYACH